MRIIGNNPAAENAEITAIASGTLADGKTVVVNADGTVSVVSASGGGPTAGSTAVFESALVAGTASTFDSNSNKVVIGYADGGNSYYATAVVGTVSGTSISFGTPTVLISASIGYMSATFDNNSNKVIFAYQDQGTANRGYAIVGTVSGTGISFGTQVRFEVGNTAWVSATFDSNLNKVVIAFRDDGDSNYGKAVVGTVSGTSISFGAAVTFKSEVASFNAATFDSNSNKVVIAYQGSGNRGEAIVGTVSGTTISFGSIVTFSSSTSTNQKITFDSNSNRVVIIYTNSSNYGTSIVGTVSGTDISFGTAVVWESGGQVSVMSATFDNDANKVVIAYSDPSNNYYGTGIVGTVSGTAISFGDKTVFNSNGNSSQLSSAFDSNSNGTVMAFRDGGNSNYGTSAVLQTSGSNLTAENFIGFANGAASDGGTARVQIGSAINGAQSSLTAGQQYFVQTNGTIGLTADDPSVIAGTAVSATDIIVKG